MNTWVQLKDGVAFACVQTPTFVENSILLEDGVSWEDVKAKKYENGSWVEAPLIYFVTQFEDNIVRGINSTVFSSDAIGEIVSKDVAYGWVKNEDNSYSPPPPPPLPFVPIVEETFTPTVEETVVEE